jgi:hypothetical protein
MMIERDMPNAELMRRANISANIKNKKWSVYGTRQGGEHLQYNVLHSK